MAMNVAHLSFIHIAISKVKKPVKSDRAYTRVRKRNKYGKIPHQYHGMSWPGISIDFILSRENRRHSTTG